MFETDNRNQKTGKLKIELKIKKSAQSSSINNTRYRKKNILQDLSAQNKPASNYRIPHLQELNNNLQNSKHITNDELKSFNNRA